MATYNIFDLGTVAEKLFQKIKDRFGNVDNTADANKSVKYATTAGSATDTAKMSNAVVERTAWTEATWNGVYGTKGHEENWSGTESLTSKCPNGAMFLIAGASTDIGNYHVYIYQRTTTASTLYGKCVAHLSWNKYQVNKDVPSDAVFTDTTYAEATTEAAGLMSATDKSTLDAIDLSKYLPLTGGTLTGNLVGKYITGTWLRTTAGTHSGSKQNKVAVLDSSGWVYHRTLDELKSDMGISGGVTSAAATLLASGWSGTEAPYTYDLSTLVSGITEDSSVTVGYDGTSYAEESLEAMQDAYPLVGGQGTTITAYGDKPTVDIPIIIEYST